MASGPEPDTVIMERGIVALTYFKASDLPAAIQENITTNYSDFQLVKGEFICGLQQGKNV